MSQGASETVNEKSGVSRRGFLRSGLACGIIAAAGSAAGQTPSSSSLEKQKTAGGSVSTLYEGIDMGLVTIRELHAALRSGKLTSSGLVAWYSNRIAAFDKGIMGVNAIIEMNPEAGAIAAALDRELQAKGPRSVLHGIPILIKDNIDTFDQMSTTAGSLALVGAKPRQDSTIVTRLRSAGAVILGKTNLSEWANFRSSSSISGWSGRGGQTRNPHALDRNPCGSSSGSAAAVAALFCAAAIGTETDGSIVCPSGVNGIVGLKPTVGLVSRAGIIPISSSQDTAGPMTRSVEDAAVLLGILAGEDSRDAVTSKAGAHRQKDYLAAIPEGGLKGVRIGVVRNYFGFSEHVDAVIGEAMSLLKQHGAVLVDPVEHPHHESIDDHEFTVLLFEFKAGLNAYLADLSPGSPQKSLRDIIRFNEAHRDRELAYFGQDLFITAETKGSLENEAYLEAVKMAGKFSREEGIDAMLAEQNLDVLMAPTNAPAWLTDPINGDHYLGGSSSAAAVAGYPNITVPAGSVHGLPIGISFFSRAWSEPVLLRVAGAFERVSKARRVPQFLKTVSMSG